MYIAFEGVLGTTGPPGLRAVFVEACDAIDGALCGALGASVCTRDVKRCTASGTGVGSGGGKGDMDMLVIEAEWAW